MSAHTPKVAPFTPASRTPRMFIAWLAISSALHGALLAGWPTTGAAPELFVSSIEWVERSEPSQPSDKPAAEKPAAQKSRGLRSATASPPEQRAMQNERYPHPVSTRADAGPVSGTIALPAVPVQAEIQDLQKTSDTSNSAPAPSQTGAIAQVSPPHPSLVLDEIRARFERMKIYPALALRYGWEGRVLLGFHARESGIINNVHVARSSGNSVLDQSAVHMLNKVGRLPTAMRPKGSLLDLQLPILYKLTAG